MKSALSDTGEPVQDRFPKPISITSRSEPVVGQPWNPWVEGVSWKGGGSLLTYRIEWVNGTEQGISDTYGLQLDPSLSYPQNLSLRPNWTLFVGPDTGQSRIIALIFVMDAKDHTVAHTTWDYPLSIVPQPEQTAR